MASISTSIQLYDRVSQPLQRMTAGMRNLEQAFSNMDRRMNTGFNPSSIRAMRDAVDETASAMEELGRNITENGERQRNFNDSVRTGANASEKLLSKIRSIVSAYMGIQGMKALVNISDEMTSTRARINLMNESFQKAGKEGTASMEQIYSAAQDARGAITSMASVVARFGNNAGDAFSSTSEVIKFTSTVQKQMVLAGASTSEAENAILQLSQALGSGTLRGDELRSVFEQAPNLIQSIADYMDIPIGKIRDMAKEGKITANIVKNAIMASANEVDTRFKQMPKTWSQVWQSLKNEAIMAFQPVLDTISRMANDERVQRFFSDIIGGIANIANAVANVVSFIASEWDVLRPVFEAVGGAIAALIAVQLAFNAAAQANPLVWILDIILAVVAAVGLLSQAIADVTGAAKTGAGVICGALNVVKTVVVNLAHQAVTSGYQSVGLIVDAVNNGKNTIIGAITAIASQILQSVANSMAAVKGFIELLNCIPGVDIDTSGVEAVRSGLQGGADAFGARSRQAWEDFKTPAELIESYRERGDEFRQMNGWQDDWSEGWVQRAWEEGVNFGDNLFAGGGESSAYDVPTYDLGDYANMIDGTGIPDNAQRAADALEITSEDLKYLRDIAERDVINRFTTAEITVEMGGVTNNVNENADLDGIVSYLASGVQEAMEIAAEGV